VSAIDCDRRILLLGASGQLGWELQRTLAPLGEVIAPNRSGCDLADLARLPPTLAEMAPALIVNAAAYTAVDQAEDDQQTAQTVNGAAPGLLAEFARKRSIPLLQFSTDYVFDGRGRVGPDGLLQAYRESDAPAPVNAYGASKLQGENAVRAAGCAYLVLRTAWIYGNRGRNFLNTILKLAGERDQLRVVNDQIGCPTWARLLAEATAQILAMTWARDGWEGLAEVSGTYHLAAAGATNWHEFADAILTLEAAPGASRVPVVPIASAEYPTKAARPAYSVLDCGKAARMFGIALPDWRIGLTFCLAERPT
jgi:dTDP-4-dehydrorhamnose reductase